MRARHMPAQVRIERLVSKGREVLFSNDIYADRARVAENRFQGALAIGRSNFSRYAEAQLHLRIAAIWADYAKAPGFEARHFEAAALLLLDRTQRKDAYTKASEAYFRVTEADGNKPLAPRSAEMDERAAELATSFEERQGYLSRAKGKYLLSISGGRAVTVEEIADAFKNAARVAIDHDEKQDLRTLANLLRSL